MHLSHPSGIMPRSALDARMLRAPAKLSLAPALAGHRRHNNNAGTADS